MYPRKVEVVPASPVEQVIRLIRGHRVILDSDLATLYGVTTKRFNEQVKRNLKRFPADFMFRLTPEEFAALRSQFATSSSVSRGGRRYLPYAFTEHGAVMLASVLNSPRAVEMSVWVVRAFVKLRQLLATQKGLAAKVADLEDRVGQHDEVILEVVEAVKELMTPPPAKPPKKIGFRHE